MIRTTTEIDHLIRLLRGEPGFERAELTCSPTPLTGGFWASLSLLTLANVEPPSDVLVLRVMPDSEIAAKETTVQREVVRQGFSAPSIRLSGGASSGVGGSFLLMDRAPGRPPLEGLDGLAAIRHLPALLRGLPDLLGRITAELHRLDPDPLQASLRALKGAAPGEPFGFIAQLRATAGELDRRDLSDAAEWLVVHPPPSRTTTIVHGDLHPFNVLVDGDHWNLLDWSTALIADPAHDLAFTTLILANPPLVAPAPLRPVIRAAGGSVARRFVTAYRLAGGHTPDAETLDWYTSLHALRILTQQAGWGERAMSPELSSHPWTSLGPIAAQVLSRTTGIAVTPLQG